VAVLSILLDRIHMFALIGPLPSHFRCNFFTDSVGLVSFTRSLIVPTPGFIPCECGRDSLRPQCIGGADPAGAHPRVEAGQQRPAPVQHQTAEQGTNGDLELYGPTEGAKVPHLDHQVTGQNP
jgi:hypothetical protein